MISRFLTTLKLLLLSLGLGICAGCTPARQDTGILVIAVEGLKSEDLSCVAGEESDLRGFNFLCQNFVHVQGLIANSTSNASNLATLLTGAPPARHGLRHNDQSLAAAQVSLAEKLVPRGWRTSFFTGGAPLLRRTRLDQGFEIFDESNPSSPRLPYRSLELTVRPFFNWLKETEGARHLAFITTGDLLYPEFPSISDKGESRPRSLEGEVEELDETLFHFFEEAQRGGLWKKWWIVVVGLPGRGEVLNRRPVGLQINPTAMLVPLYLRPPATVQMPDNRVSGVWSFAELGEFLREIADDIDAGAARTPAERGQFFLQKWRDREAGFATAEGCVPREDGESFCRTAYFDGTTWLAWEAPLRLDAPGRKELVAKVQNALGPPKPEAAAVPPAPARPLEPLTACLEEFAKEMPASAFIRACPAHAVQSLRGLSEARRTSAARPEALRDQKLGFIHEFTLLAAAHHLFVKNEPTRWYAELSPAPSREFLTLQKILERPELRDLQREALRALPVRE